MLSWRWPDLNSSQTITMLYLVTRENYSLGKGGVYGGKGSEALWDMAQPDFVGNGREQSALERCTLGSR